MTHCTVYAASVAPLSDRSLYEAALSAVSPRRREKAARYRQERDRRLCLGAELLLRQGLRDAGKPYPPALTFGPHGKPYLQDEGLWFSLSHSGEWALCALADREVGCDIEEIRKTDLAIARRFFTPEEYARIAAGETPEERQERFFRLWTLKESFLKVTGRGLSLPLNAFSIQTENGITVTGSAKDRPYSFLEYSDIPDCRCAVCAEGERVTAPLRILDLAAILQKEESL